MVSRKLIITFVLLLLVAAGAMTWQWQRERLLALLAVVETPLTPYLEKFVHVGEVLLPEPLRGPLSGKAGTLTTAGVLVATNHHREINGLPPLAENATLDTAAQNKLKDMFARQYFAHEAPDGKGPGDVVKAVGYQYVRVGENLALGNFGSDTALVQAWMDSPGHRANILHTGFSEIGLAVGRGNFEGTSVWLAVQTFATPLSDCPPVDSKLQRQFDQQKTSLDTISTELAAEQAALNSEEETLSALAAEIQDLIQAGNAKIAEGNAEVAKGNSIYQETGDSSQAEPYWDRGHQLQAEGQAILAQAQTKQGEYDTKLASYEQKRSAFNTKVEMQRQEQEQINTVMSRLNQQIRSFNDCIK